MDFPTKEELKKQLEKLENSDGTLLIADDASPLEHLRWDICQKFVAFKLKTNTTQTEMAKILHHRIDEFSTDRLMKLLFLLDPSIKVKVA